MSFNAAFQFLTFATALWAFVMMAVFAELHAMAISIFLIFFVLCALRKPLRVRISSTTWLILSLAALGMALAGWFIFLQHLYSVLYLFLFLEINKLWTSERNRDALHVYGLTFFQVLAASVSTASIAFAPALAGYLFLMLGSLITLTIKRDAELALAPPAKAGSASQSAHPPMARRLRDYERLRLNAFLARRWLTPPIVRWLAATLVLVLVVGAGLFMIIPRLQAQYFLGGLSPAGTNRSVSGFTDTVDFRGLGEIQTDPTIIMRAFPVEGYSLQGGFPDPSLLKLRGTSLDNYDGTQWRKSASTASAIEENRSINVWFSRGGRRGEYQELRTSITLEPNRRGYLFGPEMPRNYVLEGPIRTLVDSEARSVQINTSNWTVPLKYDVYSIRFPDPNPAAARRRADAGADAEDTNLRENVLDFLGELGRSLRRVERSGETSGQDLQLPDHPDMETVKRLAGEWTASATSNYEVAKAIEMALKRGYDYSLDITYSNDPRHLTRFLEDEKRGHCEYFATAMALMLRAKGIPARIVNGYATDEWVSASNGYFLVRQEHAHSWVEARMPRVGWVPFDPTPSAGIGGGRIPNTLYRRLSRWSDMVKLLWYDMVIDFDSTDQSAFVRSMLYGKLKLPNFRALLTFGDGSPGSGVEGGYPVLLGMAFAALAAGIAGGWWLLARLRRRSRRGFSGKGAGARVGGTAIPEYLSLLGEFEKVRPRPPCETPLEYARVVVTHSDHLEEFVPLTAYYYAARYDGAVWGPGETTRANALLRRLREGDKPSPASQLASPAPSKEPRNDS